MVHKNFTIMRIIRRIHNFKKLMLKNRISVFFNNTKMYRPMTYLKGALNAADSELDS